MERTVEKEQRGGRKRAGKREGAAVSRRAKMELAARPKTRRDDGQVDASIPMK